ncbi:DoxX family protein [Ekhidna sp.]|uniref:DoxX family protein n=1 Tax=Ekhidna sp. TaxID=2608089 RepID=UPI0032995E59
MTFNTVLAVFTSIAFFYYGFTCLFSDYMVKEFYRFGLKDQQRILTSLLQLLGAIGIVVGIKLPFAGMMATIGLSLLMLMGFIVRIRIRDDIRQSTPSFAFMLINAYLFYFYYLSA